MPATKDTCGIGLVATIEVPATSGNPDFEIAHGLGYRPTMGVIEMTADGLIRWQSPSLKYDATNIYLNASGAGLTATVRLLAPCNCSGGTPGITSVSPATGTAGGPNFTLTVNGVNFRADSVVLWNGSARSTTYVSQTQLTATILAGDVASTGVAELTVNNPGEGCGLSGPFPFNIYNLQDCPGLAFGFVRDGEGPDGCVLGLAFLDPTTPCHFLTAAGQLPYPSGRSMKNVRAHVATAGFQLVDFHWAVKSTPFSSAPLSFEGTPVGTEYTSYNSTGWVSFGDFDVPAGQYLAFEMQLTGCGAPGGTTLVIDEFSFEWV